MTSSKTKLPKKRVLSEDDRALIGPLRRLKELTKDELYEVGSLIVKSPYSTIQVIEKSKDASTLHRMISAIARSVIDDGNVAAFNALMDRLVGKVKEQVEHSGSIEGMPQVVITLPSNGREVTVSEPIDDLL